MGTSRSADDTGQWKAGVRLFSGRTNPTWALTPAQSARLMTMRDGLPPAAPVPAESPRLGYSGCFLCDGVGHTWCAFEGVVTCSEPSGPHACGDPQRRFERAIMASAPGGLLPPDLLGD